MGEAEPDFTIATAPHLRTQHVCLSVCRWSKERPERSEVHRTNAVQAFSGRLAWGDPCLSVASVYWAW